VLFSAVRLKDGSTFSLALVTPQTALYRYMSSFDPAHRSVTGPPAWYFLIFCRLEVSRLQFSKSVLFFATEEAQPE
jgi:hypothetical protein